MKKKETNITGFSKEQIRIWENSDCTNFAIALGRITGWLLNVDWWNPIRDNQDVNKMKSLRAYVGNDSQRIFDLRGNLSINTFCNSIILPLAKKRVKIDNNEGGILTRYYSESKMFGIPLRIKPNKERINIAEKAIRGNINFLNKIPLRNKPLVPAHIAADYTFGRCAIFAAAMEDITNKKATAIIAHEYTPQYAYSRLGYVHSIILNSDGSATDIWGRGELETIVARFGIAKYTLDDNEHQKVVSTLKQNSGNKFIEAYKEATYLVKDYFIN